ncbi:UDP-4-amino-4,6-dideoxy-N-acetyl-beta-L-altrosamine transaminase [Duganella sp. Leaf126]|uniref:DegT/DnrJ/EryC1/StrS family aminotransferase n=1 Tax=Duganella sp. Leaf126 TaxID=1736266 RepID=UPI0006F9E95D|nr:DegT/DnrJ/EryC1/StrS family aminotransferase [Duganella sp. Leaf126]KQQ36225.1 UDP-4-amino-4,6-dideoxy-N-acetyl-beta-L-altrosamine transaminase [Duganella sp. Leaf126]
MPLPTDTFLPFALPDLGDEEAAAVLDCLRSGWITSGPVSRQFEQDFAAYLDSDVHAIAVNSATAGLHLALEALGIGPGDEVIVPTMTFTATAEVVRYLGADAVIVDVDPQTLCLQAEAIAAAITPNTRAVIPVHYGGLACDIDAIVTLARRHGLRVIEDAAHAFPATLRGRLVGTLASDATVFSFYANKTITTGEGGMVVCRDADVARRVRVMRLHGISEDAFDRFVSRRPAWFYQVVAPGFKYNLTDIAAAIGRAQLRKIDRFLARRQQLARGYAQGLAGLPLVLAPDAPAGSQHAWHLYPVRLTPEAPLSRERLIERLSEHGIGTSVHYIPLHRQPYWRDRYQLDPAQFPHAEASYHAQLTLPLYTRMTDADQARVIATLKELLC